MLELLFLLLPVAVAYGWYMGRRGLRLDEDRKISQRSRNYAAGINFLLSEQPDKAVDLFIDLLQVDEDTIDTHLALGNLFRQRGEVDRAIRIHQNLVSRCLDATDQQHLSMLELARDYVAGGLLDRAELVLLKLQDDEDLVDDARKMLLQVYEQLTEWQKAIDVATKLADKKDQKIVAQYYCQLAEQDLANSEAKQSIVRLKKHSRLIINASVPIWCWRMYTSKSRSSIMPCCISIRFRKLILLSLVRPGACWHNVCPLSIRNVLSRSWLNGLKLHRMRLLHWLMLIF